MRERQTHYIRRAVIAGVILAGVIGSLWLASSALTRIAHERALAALREHFGGDLQLQSLNVQLFPSARIDAEGLAYRVPGHADLPPLVRIQRLTGTSNLLNLLRKHISLIDLEGLRIEVPPKPDRPVTAEPRQAKRSDFVIDELRANGSTVITMPSDPEKEPLEWDIEQLTLYHVGTGEAADFRAVLTNAKPPGRIRSAGKFGPWDNQDPDETPVSGNYTFRDADLSVFNGIAGILSSEGSYRGVLGRIEVAGHTDTPGFTLESAGNPVDLTTDFQAVVDGTGGNTLLQPVRAKFGDSILVATGSVEGRKGLKGKTIALDVTVPGGRLEDILRLGVKGQRPAIRGALVFHTKLVIPPGDQDITKKLRLNGSFSADSARFSELDIQTKLNKLSHSGEGDPQAPDSDNVASDFMGRFALNHGRMDFQNLSFQVPGVGVSLDGSYDLSNQELDFSGTARLKAKLSQTTTGFKSLLLKAVDPLFKRKDAGAVLPIHIRGTREQPSFGLDLGKVL